MDVGEVDSLDSWIVRQFIFLDAMTGRYIGDILLQLADDAAVDWSGLFVG